MKMKKVTITEPDTSFGIRMVKAACTPDIAGLFLQNENLEWTLTELTVNQFIYSFLPVRLLGEICNLPVAWRTAWQPSGYSGSAPIFFGGGPVGVVGYEMTSGSPGNYSISIQAGVLSVWATVAGHEYGPVKLTIT